jgi:hypothetical protein
VLGVAAGAVAFSAASRHFIIAGARESILSGGTDKGGEGQQRRVVAYQLWRSGL